ncbi:Lrp/AsnC family transcription regulator [Natronomonas pharaonis DSM 2160]|uniref:Lrp/AsnC family transcription regulator n=1 Tax=Natronomonas pharaonis (strain ATCC 35678 / DSM 2160 / CIP 103997 / JCM 8858 / NBRC 14720 / NCIMB 2260 / Gabara) TaxID=348780 RepID=A0A1U7EUC1_NATPD|nr:Lrp/AsnC family transcriptional regulator [Natronomonas pharaonis]CAI48553.1 Lrp/AsnC family transcription regulator [Natronomonas pharaonis DSM 2160]
MGERLDRQLVAALCRDARADITDIAAPTDAVATTVQKRLRALEDDGAIDGYAPRLNYERLGYETVIFQLSVPLGSVDDVTDRLRATEAFVTVYQTDGDRTVFAVGKFEDESAVAAQLHKLHDDPDIRDVDTSPVQSVHAEGDCPIPLE